MRLFHCDDCGHHMRLGGTRCGKCYTPKRAVQQPTALAGLILALLAAVLVGLVLMLMRHAGI
ncbi:MAG: hypothetical protein CL813_10945 [Confluentimicrobium sp.]|nr:hypothetical protein [Actibacterium sp.]MBF53443.1 hypothetical protein [Actibacterium sp.]OWU70103.1 hypothetical protein ATO2_05850 [Roseovarius sp. 22II1-1F6A]|tara:strand:+ start:360 stop:545 length:186 start_codon:yes stop_codon:yes gene_type:complete